MKKKVVYTNVDDIEWLKRVKKNYKKMSEKDRLEILFQRQKPVTKEGYRHDK